MTEKFTQGEWHVTDDDCEGVTTSQSTECVCYINRSQKEFKSNAPLIAAAPDMYRMLETLREDYGLLTVVGKEIDALLAKARGEK